MWAPHAEGRHHEFPHYRFASPFAERFDLRVPVVQAPMAGGPTSPAMVGAVSNAGALGFLAAAQHSAEKLASEVAAINAPDQTSVRRESVRAGAVGA